MGRPIPQGQVYTDVGVRDRDAQPLQRVMQAARKVPEVTVYFWISKLLSTGMGETMSDYLVRQLNPFLVD